MKSNYQLISGESAPNSWDMPSAQHFWTIWKSIWK